MYHIFPTLLWSFREQILVIAQIIFLIYSTKLILYCSIYSLLNYSLEKLSEKSRTPNIFRKCLPFCDFLGTVLNCSRKSIIRADAEANLLPIRTLSGGELFLVSLSLALALPERSIGRLRLESLFFGVHSEKELYVDGYL